MGSIFHKGESRKTDILNYHLSEPLTSIDILNRLREAAHITEHADPSDKQAKLVKHTAKGEEMLFEYCHRLHSIESLPFGELAEEDKKLCIQLLKKVKLSRPI